MEPRPLASKVQSPNHWTTREFPRLVSLEGFVELKLSLSPNYNKISYHCHSLFSQDKLGYALTTKNPRIVVA